MRIQYDLQTFQKLGFLVYELEQLGTWTLNCMLCVVVNKTKKNNCEKCDIF